MQIDLAWKLSMEIDGAPAVATGQLSVTSGGADVGAQIDLSVDQIAAALKDNLRALIVQRKSEVQGMTPSRPVLKLVKGGADGS